MSHSSTSTANMKEEIERLFEAGSRAHEVPLAHATFERFREALSHGEIRAAEKSDGKWHVNTCATHGILPAFPLRPPHPTPPAPPSLLAPAPAPPPHPPASPIPPATLA